MGFAFVKQLSGAFKGQEVGKHIKEAEVKDLSSSQNTAARGDNNTTNTCQHTFRSDLRSNINNGLTSKRMVLATKDLLNETTVAQSGLVAGSVPNLNFI